MTTARVTGFQRGEQAPWAGGLQGEHYRQLEEVQRRHGGLDSRLGRGAVRLVLCSLYTSPYNGCVVGTDGSQMVPPIPPPNSRLNNCRMSKTKCPSKGSGHILGLQGACHLTPSTTHIHSPCSCSVQPHIPSPGLPCHPTLLGCPHSQALGL